MEIPPVSSAYGGMDFYYNQFFNLVGPWPYEIFKIKS
jgi:hypothetical protein